MGDTPDSNPPAGGRGRWPSDEIEGEIIGPEPEDEDLKRRGMVRSRADMTIDVRPDSDIDRHNAASLQAEPSGRAADDAIEPDADGWTRHDWAARPDEPAAAEPADHGEGDADARPSWADTTYDEETDRDAGHFKPSDDDVRDHEFQDRGVPDGDYETGGDETGGDETGRDETGRDKSGRHGMGGVEADGPGLDEPDQGHAEPPAYEAGQAWDDGGEATREEPPVAASGPEPEPADRGTWDFDASETDNPDAENSRGGETGGADRTERDQDDDRAAHTATDAAGSDQSSTDGVTDMANSEAGLGAGGTAGMGAGGMGTGGTADAADSGAETRKNLYVRLLYMVGFGTVAWVLFGLILLLAVMQFIVCLLNKEANEELRAFTRRTIVYLSDLLAYLTFQKEDKPFPLGPLPR